MITGYNTDIKHNDRMFHVQTEDRGVDNPIIESLIYMGGKIVASKQYCYASLLRDGYSERAVQDMLDSQHRKMVRDIRGGKYDQEGPPIFGAGIITDRGFDDLVLEFLKGQTALEKLELVMEEHSAPKAGETLAIALAVRGDLRNAPVAAAKVSILAALPGGAPASLFTGQTDEAGRLSVTIEVPREYAGGKVTIEASGRLGADQVVLEIAS